jgi:hypothetical protein
VTRTGSDVVLDNLEGTYHRVGSGSPPYVTALAAAGGKPVAVLYNPSPREAARGALYYDVWQLAIDGQPVRSMAQVQAGWRSNNRVAAWLFPCFLFTGIYCAVLAWRARCASKPFDDRPWIDLA